MQSQGNGTYGTQLAALVQRSRVCAGRLCQRLPIMIQNDGFFAGRLHAPQLVAPGIGGKERWFHTLQAGGASEVVGSGAGKQGMGTALHDGPGSRSEEHTSELQS